jgi:hypothetical protein
LIISSRPFGNGHDAPSVFLSTRLFALSSSVTDVQRGRSNAKQETAAHKRSRKRTRGSPMNAGRAFDRDSLRGSSGYRLIDDDWFRNGRATGLQQVRVAVIIGGHDVQPDAIT